MERNETRSKEAERARVPPSIKKLFEEIDDLGEKSSPFTGPLSLSLSLSLSLALSLSLSLSRSLALARSLALSLSLSLSPSHSFFLSFSLPLSLSFSHAPKSYLPAAPYTAPGILPPAAITVASSLGGPVPVTSFPTVTQKSLRLFLRPKISR